MPGGFFPATEPEAAVTSVLDLLRRAVETEPALQAGSGGATIHAELRTTRLPAGDLGLKRFYWSRQQADPQSQHGVSAHTLFYDDSPQAPWLHQVPSDPGMDWLGAPTRPLRGPGRPGRGGVPGPVRL